MLQFGLMRKPIQTIKQRLQDEIGSHFTHGPRRVAMLYPSPYRAGMSSLGYQWAISILADAGFSVERVFLPDDVDEWKKQWRCSSQLRNSNTTLSFSCDRYFTGL